MVHQRSEKRHKEKEQEHEQKKTVWEIVRRTVLDFSYHDPLGGEIVFDEWFKNKVIEVRLRAKYGGRLPECWSRAVDKEFGEVLNRFPMKAVSTVNYEWRGTVNK